MRKTKSYRMESILEERIVMGDYTLLDFPAERKLAAAFNVTQMTARKAVKNLERRGLLRRLPNGSRETESDGRVSGACGVLLSYLSLSESSLSERGGSRLAIAHGSLYALG